MPKRSRSRSRSPVKSASKIYCLACRKKTANQNAVNTHDKRGKPRIACKCLVCGTKKFKYVKH